MSVDDDASDYEMRDRERAIAAARHHVQPPPLTPATECANACGSAPKERSAYCSCECRGDAERRQAQMKRQGAA